MLPDLRGLAFDLDDTLYPYRRFVWSGFREVARAVQWSHGLDASATFRSLALASRGASRGRELQTVLRPFGVTDLEIRRLVVLLRRHEPTLRLPHATRRLLARLRGAGWKLAVVTNGDVDIQRRKVDALGLARYVDAVVYAQDVGQRTGKPDPEAFDEAVRQLSVPAGAVVVVGDDEAADIGGARAAGLLAIRCEVWRRDARPSCGHAVARRFSQIPGLARVLVEEASSHHAA